MANVLNLTPREAREFLTEQRTGAIEVDGLIDLRDADLNNLSASISCHDLMRAVQP